jgi:hypothetical protein
MKKPGKTLAILALALFWVGPARATEPVDRPIVVELYTSQGCSSCPPADALIAKLSQRKDVIALSLPITYWDMLGWRDTLATDPNTRRQKAYAEIMGHGGVYTPQVIVDGINDIVGSREGAVNAAIATRKSYIQALQARLLAQTLPDRQKLLDIPVTLNATPREIRVVVGQARDHTNHDATVWLFRVMSQAVVKIESGENSGRTVTYRNVVRDVKAIGVWKGQQVTLDLPRSDSAVPHDGVAVVVQQGGYGRIFGAAFIGHPNYYAVQ